MPVATVDTYILLRQRSHCMDCVFILMAFHPSDKLDSVITYKGVITYKCSPQPPAAALKASCLLSKCMYIFFTLRCLLL